MFKSFISCVKDLIVHNSSGIHFFEHENFKHLSGQSLVEIIILQLENWFKSRIWHHQYFVHGRFVNVEANFFKDVLLVDLILLLFHQQQIVQGLIGEGSDTVIHHLDQLKGKLFFNYTEVQFVLWTFFGLGFLHTLLIIDA